jgi:hypothetical protein
MSDPEMDRNTSGPIRRGLCLDIDDLAASLRLARQSLSPGVDGLAGFGAAGRPTRRLCPRSGGSSLKGLRLGHPSALEGRSHRGLGCIGGRCRSGAVRFRDDRRRRRYVDVHHRHSQAKLSERSDYGTTRCRCHINRTGVTAERCVRSMISIYPFRYYFRKL